jgi:hypothetical protein
VAHAGVEGLADELDAVRLELGAGRGDVGNAQRDVVRVRRERKTDLLGLPDAERHLSACHLEASGGHVTIERQAEGIQVEPARPFDVLADDGEKVDPLDLQLPY